VAAALFAQKRQRRLSKGDCAEDVGLEDGSHLGEARLLDRTHEAVAGVAQDNIEPSKAAMGGRDRLKHRITVGHVDAQRKNPVPVCLDEAGDRVRIPHRGGNPVAARERALRP
jgi:hypothetical protein